MPLRMTRDRALLRLLRAGVFLGMCTGCVAVGKSLGEAHREVVVEMVAAPPTAAIELMVSNGQQDVGGQYPTTLRVVSENAKGFSGSPGSAGKCSGVLIAKNLVLTAAHCMCLQPIRASVNKAINRTDCATRARVKQYVRKIVRSKDDDIESIISKYPSFSGSAFLPEEFRVDLDEEGQITSTRADVAVIRLDSQIDIKLDYEPADREFREDDRITVVGFGSTSVNGKEASDSRNFGKNTVTGIRVMEYEPRPPPNKKHREGHFHRAYEANTEVGDSGGPCFREEGARRWLMGIMLQRMNATGVKTSCLDLFHSKPLLERLIQQAKDPTD